MSVAPPRKKSWAVFWIAAVVIGSIILATALLANDMRNLRALDSRYHLNLFPRPEQKPTSPPAKAVEGERNEWPTAFVIDGIGFWLSVRTSALPASA
jgi:hypothetical protein